MKHTLPKLLTIKEASKATGIPARTFYTWIHSDRSFPAVKIRGRVFLRQNDFWYWLQINSQAVAV